MTSRSLTTFACHNCDEACCRSSSSSSESVTKPASPSASAAETSHQSRPAPPPMRRESSAPLFGSSSPESKASSPLSSKSESTVGEPLEPKKPYAASSGSVTSMTVIPVLLSGPNEINVSSPCQKITRNKRTTTRNTTPTAHLRIDNASKRPRRRIRLVHIAAERDVEQVRRERARDPRCERLLAHVRPVLARNACELLAHDPGVARLSKECKKATYGADVDRAGAFLVMQGGDAAVARASAAVWDDLGDEECLEALAHGERSKWVTAAAGAMAVWDREYCHASGVDEEARIRLVWPDVRKFRRDRPSL